jgi:hypothetical protein
VKKREEGFSLFFREEYPAPRRRAYSLRKKREREKGKETEGGRTLPMNRFTSVSLRAHASTTRRRLRLLFVFPLSLSLLKFEREREERKKKRGKTLKLRSGKERGSEAGYGSMFNKVWEGANRRDAIIRTTRQDMFLGRFNQFII